MDVNEFVKFLNVYNNSDVGYISPDNILSITNIKKTHFGIEVTIIRRIFLKTETWETNNIYDEGWRTVDCNEIKEETYYFDEEIFSSKNENDMIKVELKKQINKHKEEISYNKREIKEIKEKIKKLEKELTCIK